MVDKNPTSVSLDSSSKAKVQYDKSFPTLFDLGSISKTDERLVNAILSELHRLPYSEKGIEIDYDRLAMLVGGQYVKKIIVNGETCLAVNNQSRLNLAVENIGTYLGQVHYKKVIDLDEYGVPKTFDQIFLFKDKFRFDRGKRVLTVYLSDYIYQDEILNESGEIELPQRRVYELFYQEDWSKIQYLKYNLFIHNSLSSQYSMRLYREIAGYRSYGSYYSYAKNFEQSVMKLDTKALLQNKSVLIKKALAELQGLKDQYDNPIFPELEMEIERKRNKTYKYILNFKEFTNDLLPVLGIDEQGRYILDFGSKSVQDRPTTKISQATFDLVMEVFHQILGTDSKFDNPNNRKVIEDCLQVMEPEVVIKALERTGDQSSRRKRGFGWTRGVLTNWKKDGVRTLEDLKAYEENRFNPTKAKMNEFIKEDSQFEVVFDLLSHLSSSNISEFVLEDIYEYYKKGMTPSLIAQAIKRVLRLGENSWKAAKNSLDEWLSKEIYDEFTLNLYLTDLEKEFRNAMDLWKD